MLTILFSVSYSFKYDAFITMVRRIVGPPNLAELGLAQIGKKTPKTNGYAPMSYLVQ